MVWGRGSSFTALHADIAVPALFVKHFTISQLNGFGTVVENQLAIDV